jgi:amino-acid N-acetyltransferase
MFPVATSNTMKHFGDLRGILHYVPQFRGRIFVIAIDGAVVAADNFSNILLDLAVLHSLNIRIVLVHGAGLQIRDLAAERGIAISNDDGTGVTDATTLELSIDAISRLANQIMQNLTTVGLRAATSNALLGHPAGVIEGEDWQFTGTVERIDARGLKVFLSEEMIPVISPLAYDGHGRTLRINSDAAALAVAEALGADKILFISNGRIESKEGINLRHLPVAQARELLAMKRNDLSQRFRSILHFATRACSAGVRRVHIVDGQQREVLLAELFSNEGVGTMVYIDEYDQIRQARPGDVPEIVSMIRAPVQEAELIPRKRSEISAAIRDYYLLEIDGNPVGSVAIHFHAASQSAELACLYVKKDHEKQGYGGRLVGFAEKKAKELGANRIFALTTHAAGFFNREHGYEQASANDLPAHRREKYNASRRNSIVLVKQLVEPPAKPERKRAVVAKS